MSVKEAIEVKFDGVTHYPFADASKFIFPNSIDEHHNHEFLTILAETPLRYRSSKGLFFAYHLQISSAETPLGKVRFVESHLNGLEYVDEVPLSLGVSFYLDAFENYQALLDMAIKIRLGRKTYTLACIDPFDGDEQSLQELIEKGYLLTTLVLLTKTVLKKGFCYQDVQGL